MRGVGTKDAKMGLEDSLRRKLEIVLMELGFMENVSMVRRYGIRKTARRINTLDISLIISLRFEEEWNFQMVMYMKAIGKVVSGVVLVNKHGVMMA